MLIVLSPAKSLDYKTPVKVKAPTLPEFVSESAKLIAELRKLAPQDIAKLMGLSDQLATLNGGAIEIGLKNSRLKIASQRSMHSMAMFMMVLMSKR